MKSMLTLMLLLVGQLSYAQTLKEKKIRIEMTERVDTLIEKSTEARKALDKEDVVVACSYIDQLFKIYPDHLTAIGTKMSLFDNTAIRMEAETKLQLIYIHEQVNTCNQGERGENLNIRETDSALKNFIKMLKKHKKRLKKADLTNNNQYNYYYELN